MVQKKQFKRQMLQDVFKLVADANSLLWYCLSNAADLWQPVAGYAACLKSLIANQAHGKWLEIINNVERWFNNEQSYTEKPQ